MDGKLWRIEHLEGTEKEEAVIKGKRRGHQIEKRKTKAKRMDKGLEQKVWGAR